MELINFDWNETSGITKTSFNFDGIDDYIKIKYDSEEEKQKLANNGFTFEFYGIYNGGTSYDENNEVMKDYDYRGIFCYWNGNEKDVAKIRFGIKNDKITWNAGFANYLSDYSQSTAYWNILYPSMKLDNEKIYITITVDCSSSITINNEEYYKAILYINGKKMLEGNYNKKTWTAFITDDLNDLNYFCIGRSQMNAKGRWHYSTMSAYSVRLYNKALTEEKVTQNYEKSVAYHESL